VVTSAVNASLEAAWNDCLDATSFATHYTAPEFFRESYFQGMEPFAVLATDGTTIAGVITGFVNGRDMVCGHAGSPRVCVRHGTDSDEVGRVLAAGLCSHVPPSVEFISVYTWNRMPGFETAAFRSRRFAAPLGTILLDLSQGTGRLFRQCSEAGRNKIRQAIKAGVEVTEMNVAREFDEYYRLYQHWCEFNAAACQPYEIQRSVFESQGNRLILVARHYGRMIGVSTFRFRKPGLIESAANVSRREDAELCQNELLLWRGIEWSVQQKSFSHFSMTGAHFFLQKFGGELHATYRYSLDRTFLRRRDTIAALRSAAGHLYHRLPEPVKKTARRLRQRRSEED